MNEYHTNPMPKLKLRIATTDDVSLILAFIKALAEYEKLAHEVTADRETLTRSLFGNHKVAEVVIAEYCAEPAGFAVFFQNFSTFLGKPGIYLEDLFVKPEFRGRGIGRALLSFLAKIAIERDCGRLEGSVLDWNTPAICFYKTLGAKLMEEWTVFRITSDSLTELSRS
ncbi:MAG: GNAT family N-acetyltransferase [Myxococcota bacterium]|nr:GNAT family N-acetyltransferase [Myxococcota bacterium]